MNFEDLVFGWREALLGVVALLALYVFVVYRRLRRLRNAAAAPAATPLAEPTPIPGMPDLIIGPGAAAYAEAAFPWNEPPDPAPDIPLETAVIDDSRLQAAEAEIGELRNEVAIVRGELAALREEVKLKVERVQAAQHVAPVYGDAMQMAVAGYDAAAIAERCGVARAEAELVVALIRNREGTEPTMRER
jgi:HAMP domain-containing protein